MPRKQNKPSVIQSDPQRFGPIVAAIETIGIEALADLGLAGRTSYFKYKKGDPVNPRVERAILKSLQESGGVAEGDLKALADQVIHKHIRQAV